MKTHRINKKKRKKEKDIAFLCLQTWRKDGGGGAIIHFDLTKDAFDSTNNC
jgi:hypothetical protein